MHTQRGLSLVELMVTLSLIGVLLAGVAPGFRDFMNRQQAVSLNNRLLAHLAMARTQAVVHRATTVVCPSALDAQQCRNGGDWSEQWLVFIDIDGDLQRDANETVISQEAADLPPGWRLVSSIHRPRVRYKANGMSTGSNLSIRLCNGNTAHSAIVMNNAGRPRLDKSPRGGCDG
ncbi:GspH/FimT family pseudopilin [Pseudomarimonas arenosa]|uniref:Type II secretion system protein H n=1 Tax=Pseudomarimonas arenosa TaxID=2774145 RepID=A0AAW3ZMN1_9GAMM|nr:GspH/FimT family pseudopilin [Pseudomarimonas arenosa]MBD8526789.1 GspH/FimT family pseudopilin [Pseudomarimonas arenosa]